jgi:hypothetical protein
VWTALILTLRWESAVQLAFWIPTPLNLIFKMWVTSYHPHTLLNINFELIIGRCVHYNGVSTRRKFWARMVSVRTNYAYGNIPLWSRWQSSLAILQEFCTWHRCAYSFLIPFFEYFKTAMCSIVMLLF